MLHLTRLTIPVQLNSLLQNVRDSNLRSTLEFGIGLHHAGLHEKDRKVVEELFVNQKIQVSMGHTVDFDH